MDGREVWQFGELDNTCTPLASYATVCKFDLAFSDAHRQMHFYAIVQHDVQRSSNHSIMPALGACEAYCARRVECERS